LQLSFDADLGVLETPDGASIALTRSERSALELLWKNPKRVITREQFLDVLSEPGSDKRDRNVDFLINRLRRKLLDDAREPRFIATRYGEGYVWIADTPVSIHTLADADVVIGPVLGLRLVTDPEDAAEFARVVARSLAQAFGAETKAVFAPDCPPPERFGTTAPRLSVELSFFRDRGRTDCVVAIKVFRSRRVLVARRLGVGPSDKAVAPLDEVSRQIVDTLWRMQVTTPLQGDPLPVALLTAWSAEDSPVRAPDTASNRQLLATQTDMERRTLAQWEANESRLRALLDAEPDDPEVKLLLALNIQSKYVTAGSGIFAHGDGNCAADEDEIEALVTEALPHVLGHPDYAIIAGKLLHFVQRGYDDLARDLCERAFAESVAVSRSLSIVGQMRTFFGETDPALDCLDHALDLARPGSHAHLYALVIKCQTLAAAGRWDALSSAWRELAGANSIAGFVLEPLFCDPQAPSMRARALAFLLSRRRARGIIMHNHYVSARLFQDRAQAANSLRSVVRVLSGRFGPDIVPDDIRAVHGDFWQD